jgi:hypothetical protein
MTNMTRRLLFGALTGALALAGLLTADEGMWLFDQFPRQTVAQKYGFQVTDPFLDHMRLSSVRFNNGGSGSFISPSGLLFTNHHVGSDCIQKLSSAEHDYMGKGFYAAAQADEKKCPDLEVNILLKTEDVTAKVNEAVKEGMPTAEANRLRKIAMTKLEKECNAATGNRCDTVTLFSGGQYHLYQYKKYTDVRLAFAPEEDIAAFGGDPDNFTYPRYCLDFALFRAYEDGKPVDSSKNYFRWSKEGVKDGELAFVPGHPGSTGRLATFAELEFSRDLSYPFILRRLKSQIDALEAYGAESAENKRVARDNLLGAQNSFKAYTGFMAGLRDRELMERKHSDEKKLRAAVADDPKKQAAYGKVWDEVAQAYKTLREFYPQYWLLERNATRGSDLLNIARNIVRYSEETAKPNEQRLREFSDTALPSLEQELYSEAPISESMEIAVLTDYFQFLQKELGASDPTVKAVLAGKSPKEAAGHYVKTTKLQSVAERKSLAKDAAKVKSSTDGMIQLALLLDEPARRYRKMYEDKVEAALISSASRVAQARFAVLGANEYPDATFTLRLAYGPVKGYTNAKGEKVPYATRISGVYKRATGKEPFRLPPSWVQAKNKLDGNTPFDFVTTNDTHGGNSGSPTLNTKGEIIGILFDGNIEGLPNRFVYTEEQARSVHVASQVIVEALNKVYGAKRILQEIGMAAAAATPAD